MTCLILSRMTYAIHYNFLKFGGRYYLSSVLLCFYKGSSPQVTKGTKVVLPFRHTQREFTRAPQNWDVRLHQQDGLIITLQVCK